MQLQGKEARKKQTKLANDYEPFSIISATVLQEILDRHAICKKCHNKIQLVPNQKSLFQLDSVLPFPAKISYVSLLIMKLHRSRIRFIR